MGAARQGEQGAPERQTGGLRNAPRSSMAERRLLTPQVGGSSSPGGAFATVFGWSPEQWAAAVTRYDGELQPTVDGMIALREWWRRRQYAEPLSVRLAGVEQEFDAEWASAAFVDAAMRVAATRLPR